MTLLLLKALFLMAKLRIILHPTKKTVCKMVVLRNMCLC